MSTLRQRIISGVVGALAVGATVTGAIVAASQTEGVTEDTGRGETRGAVVEAATTLRLLGESESAIVAELAAASGAPAAEVAPIVRLAHGRDGRDAESLRTETIAVGYTAPQAPAAGAAWASALCQPLSLVPGLSARHSACVAAQSEMGGAPHCSGGAAAGWVVEMPTTPAQRARLTEALSGLAVVGDSSQAVRTATGWTVCDGG